MTEMQQLINAIKLQSVENEINKVKKALSICSADGNCEDRGCPYMGDISCDISLPRDALKVINTLEECIAPLENGETIIWHKWPEEKPAQYITVLGRIADMGECTPQVRECYMIYTEEFLFPALIGDRFHKITEWAYMPVGTPKKDGK